MKNIKKSALKLLLVVVFLILINLNTTIYAAEGEELRNATRLYFCAGITIEENGDCILLENYDANGNKVYGLIDAGRTMSTTDANGQPSTMAMEYLKQHGITKLEFFCISHQHPDHTGDAIDIINNFQIDTIYMKEYNQRYSPNGRQEAYEKILSAILDKANNGNNIKVVGVGYDALSDANLVVGTDVTSYYDYRVRSKLNENIRNNNVFTSFNKDNTKNIKFGSSTIDLFNWEIYDENGNYNEDGKYIPSPQKLVLSRENSNSLVLLLKQGNKKALFTGDLDEITNKLKNGSYLPSAEDRIKDQIGDIDFLKLAHHGYDESNTENFLNTLKPEYAIATNEAGGIYYQTANWLKNNKAEFMCIKEEEYGITATIEEDKVYLGYETEESFKLYNEKFYYLPQGGKNKNRKEELYEIEYENETIPVTTWEELKNAIESNTNTVIGIENRKCKVKRLVINVTTDLVATETITIEKGQNVILTKSTSADVKIARGYYLTNSPLFIVKGELTVGRAYMPGELAIDGNNIACTTNLIKIQKGILNLENGGVIRNNANIISTKPNLLNNGGVHYYSNFGSAVYAFNGVININGGKITNNKQEINFTDVLDKGSIVNSRIYNTLGTGIFMDNGAVLNMKSGEISNNSAINNVKVRTQDRYTYAAGAGDIVQRCDGIGVYAQDNSIINITGGTISNNRAENYASTTLRTPANTSMGSPSTLVNVDAGINGVGVYTKNSDFCMNGGIISDNTYNLNTDITLQSNTRLLGNIQSRGFGIGVCLNNSYFNINNAIVSGEVGINNTIINNYGTMETPSINNCGGGIAINNSNGIISNSIIKDNIATEGGGIYTTGKTNVVLDNITISSNTAYSGGGVKVDGGKLILTSGNINNNIAQGKGGGINFYKENQASAIVYKIGGIIANNTPDQVYPNKNDKNSDEIVYSNKYVISTDDK